MVSIGFAPELVPLINDGTKTLTYRLGNKYAHLDVGDIVLIHNSATKQTFGRIEITEKSVTDFSHLPIDRKGHEIYKTKEKQRETFERYYNIDIVDNDPFIMIGFKVL